MKKLLIICAVIAAIWYFGFQENGFQENGFQEQQQREQINSSSISAPLALNNVEVVTSDDILKQAFKQQQNDIQVQGVGRVIRLLEDDTSGSKHQKFIIQLNNHQTLLVAHNIDLAPRISTLALGDIIEFYGEYEWNNKGGVIHWTHKDPRKIHENGWLKHKGRVYQ